MLVGLEEGGRRHAEVARDIAAARALRSWLVHAHPWNWATSATSSRIADAASLEELEVERFARRGASYCNQARCAVQAYESFISKHSGLVVGGCAYPPTEELVAWFSLWSIDETRTLKRRTGKPFKGESGKQRVKALGYAAVLFGAPFEPGMLKSEVVAMATKRPPDAAEAGTAEAHEGVFVQCWFECIAAGVFPDGTPASEVEVDFACVFAIQGITSLRSVEALRASVVGIDCEGMWRRTRCSAVRAGRRRRELT